jgi:hypothetical protein
MAKEAQGVFGKALAFRALGLPPPPVEALPSLPYKLCYRFFLQFVFLMIVSHKIPPFWNCEQDNEERTKTRRT